VLKLPLAVQVASKCYRRDAFFFSLRKRPTFVTIVIESEPSP
jgi:hypothetical protein